MTSGPRIVAGLLFAGFLATIWKEPAVWGITKVAALVAAAYFLLTGLFKTLRHH